MTIINSNTGNTSHTEETLLYTPQELTNDQQTQARSNIGGGPMPNYGHGSPISLEDVKDGQLYVDLDTRNEYIYFATPIAWDQPTLSANGTAGGSSVAVFDITSGRWNYPYNAFDGKTSGNSGWQCSSTLPSEGFWALGWYTPTALLVESFTVYNRYYFPSYSNGIKDFVLQGSQDGETYTDIQSYSSTEAVASRSFTVDNPEIPYKYHRLKITSYNEGSSDRGPCIEELSITGQCAIGWVPFWGNKALTNQAALPSYSLALGTDVVSTGQKNLVLGYKAADTGKARQVVIGCNASAGNTELCLVVGPEANSDGGADAIGSQAKTTSGGIAIGPKCNATNISVAAGSQAVTQGTWSCCFGMDAKAYGTASLALGFQAIANAECAIQIGKGTNSEAKTLCVGFYSNNTNYKLLNSDGTIPQERLTNAPFQNAVLSAETAPETTTVGFLGQIYIDTSENQAYICINIDSETPAYTWKQITQ